MFDIWYIPVSGSSIAYVVWYFDLSKKKYSGIVLENRAEKQGSSYIKLVKEESFALYYFFSFLGVGLTFIYSYYLWTIDIMSYADRLSSK